MNEPLSTLLWQALFYAILNIGLRAYLKQPLISASIAFWFGWIFLISGGLISITNRWINIGTQFSPYLETLFAGAFFGFSIGTFVSVIGKPKSKYQKLVEISDEFFNKFGNRVLAALLIVGSIFFVQRLSTVGLNSSYLGEVRSIYNERNDSLLLQIGSHLTVLTTIFIILRGVYDSYNGLNLRVLFIIILCGAPLGLANGGRTFLFSYLLAYIASFLLSRSNFSNKRFNITLHEIWLLTSAIATLLVVFAIMGYIRGGYGDELDIFYTIIIWPVSTLGAMDSWVYSAIMSQRTYGLNTFGWFFEFLFRLGLIDLSSETSTIRETISYFEATSNSAAVIPRSILPDLIFDFGPSSVFFSMTAMAAILEILTSRYPGRGLLLHIVAVQSLIASFATIQNSVVTPGFAVSIFWAAIFSKLAVRYRWR